MPIYGIGFITSAGAEKISVIEAPTAIASESPPLTRGKCANSLCIITMCRATSAEAEKILIPIIAMFAYRVTSAGAENRKMLLEMMSVSVILVPFPSFRQGSPARNSRPKSNAGSLPSKTCPLFSPVSPSKAV